MSCIHFCRSESHFMPLRHPQQHGKLSCVDHFAFAPHTADRVLRDQRDGKLTLDLVECITTPNKVPQFAVQCDIVAAQQGRHFSPFNLRFKGRMKYRREKHLQCNKNVWKIWKMRNGNNIRLCYRAESSIIHICILYKIFIKFAGIALLNN